MITAHLLREKRNESPYDCGGPKQWSVPVAAEFVLRMLRFGGAITVCNAERMDVVTPLPDGGCDDDRLDGPEEDINAIARAVTYWYRTHGAQSDRDLENARISGIRDHVPHLPDHHPEVAEWLTERFVRGPDEIRIAIMLACDVWDIADLDAGLRIPRVDQYDAHGHFIAALELVRESHGTLTLRDIASDPELLPQVAA